MAKKETQNATAASKAAAAVAAEVLSLNPDINEVHVTADGTAFYKLNDARNHAGTLQNREVFSSRRAEAAAAAGPSKSRKGAPVTLSAPEGTEIDELTGKPVNDEPAKTEE